MGHIVPCLMEKTSFPNMDAPIDKRNLFLLSGRANFPIAEYHRQSPSHQCVKSVQIRSNFWSVFSCIQTECGEILRISPYSVRMRENKDNKLLRIWTLFTQWYFFRSRKTYTKSYNKEQPVARNIAASKTMLLSDFCYTRFSYSRKLYSNVKSWYQISRSDE